jgi:hypothetical protein
MTKRVRMRVAFGSAAGLCLRIVAKGYLVQVADRSRLKIRQAATGIGATSGGTCTAVTDDAQGREIILLFCQAMASARQGQLRSDTPDSFSIEPIFDRSDGRGTLCN